MSILLIKGTSENSYFKIDEYGTNLFFSPMKENVCKLPNLAHLPVRERGKLKLRLLQALNIVYAFIFAKFNFTYLR